MRTFRIALALLCTVPLTAGCALSFQNLPLDTAIGGPSYQLTAVFPDAAGLPVGGRVQIGQDVVGKVESLRDNNFQAVVRMDVQQGVRLPVGTTARLELTSALGEEYVLLQPPSSAGHGYLADSATIPVQDTSRAPDVENTLAALGALLGGSGIGQVQTIVSEANQAIGGREPELRDLLGRMDTLLTALNQHGKDIDDTIASMNTLAAQANAERPLINDALTRITPAVNVLLSQSGDFTRLLGDVSSLAGTANTVLGQTGQGMADEVNELRPVLNSLSDFDSDLGSTLTAIQGFHQLLDHAIPGDYLDMDATLDVSGTVLGLVTGNPAGSTGQGGPGSLLSGGTR